MSLGALSFFCALASSTLFSASLMMSIIRLNVFSTLFTLASLCAVVQINMTSPITRTGARSARIAPATRVRASPALPKSWITQSEDAGVAAFLSLSLHSLRRLSVRCLFNPTRGSQNAVRKRESALSFKANSSFNVLKRGKLEWSDFLLMFRRLEKTAVKAPEDAERARL